MRSRSWTIERLASAAKEVYSYRQLLVCLGLRAAGGNYQQVKKYIAEHKIDISHFKFQAWNRGMRGIKRKKIPVEQLLVASSTYQSYKLKKRLFQEGLKAKACEECGWSKISIDGHLPLELDHINGERTDNRLTNLRVLCPNCHSLKPTHRGKNRKSRRMII